MPSQFVPHKYITQSVSWRCGVKDMWQCCYSGPGVCWVSLLPFVSLAPTSQHLQQKYSGHQKPLFKKGRYNQLQHHQHHHFYHEYHCFLHHFKWQMKTRRTTNVNFQQQYLHKVLKNRRIFLSHFCKEINQTQEHKHTHTYTLTNSQMWTKEKDNITHYCFSCSFCYHSDNAYLNPDWEKSHWFSPDA